MKKKEKEEKRIRRKKKLEDEKREEEKRISQQKAGEDALKNLTAPTDLAQIEDSQKGPSLKTMEIPRNGRYGENGTYGGCLKFREDIQKVDLERGASDFRGVLESLRGAVLPEHGFGSFFEKRTTGSRKGITGMFLGRWNKFG